MIQFLVIAVMLLVAAGTFAAANTYVWKVTIRRHGKQQPLSVAAVTDCGARRRALRDLPGGVIVSVERCERVR